MNTATLVTGLPPKIDIPRHSRQNREGGEKYLKSSKRDNKVNHVFAIPRASVTPDGTRHSIVPARCANGALSTDRQANRSSPPSHARSETETTGRPPSHLYQCSPWSNLGLGSHSYELVPGLGINVGEALRRSEASRLRPEVLERDRPAECLWLGER